MRKPRRPRALLPLALLLALGGALFADALLHTDDGCVVERHCLACQWHHGATATPIAVVAVAASLQPLEEILVPGVRITVEGSTLDAASRAPPVPTT